MSSADQERLARVGDVALPGAEVAEWIAHAERIAPLVDGVEYFTALRAALTAAQREVLIVGWDLHSEIDLLRGEQAEHAEADGSWPVRLADLLHDLVEERDALQVRLLVWEGSPLFAFERQHVPRMKRPWSSHPRIRLVWDRDTPRMGSQHQKLVVIDDGIAFAGGMDLTQGRWDTHEHAPDDRRRRLPGLFPRHGSPYHDLMMAVDGEAAAKLGAWARERWRRATGESLEAPDVSGVADAPGEGAPDPWPAELEPALRDRAVAMALTQPEHAGRPEKRQVEHTYLAQIRAARRLLFIETQYFAVGEIADALAERLREPAGPEVVLILPYGCPGSVQSMAMDPRRDELLDRLREAATPGRLFVGWPTLAGGATEDVFENSVYVHAKTLVIDDRLLRIGSSNLNNRSMGLDLELDLFLAVDEDDAEGAAAIERFRQRVLASLLDVEPGAVGRAERETGSVVGAIDALRGRRKTLCPFEHRAESSIHAITLPLELADPSRPLADTDADRILELIAAETSFPERLEAARNRMIGALRRWKWPLLLGGAVLALGFSWRFTPLARLVDAEAVRSWIGQARAGPVATLAVVALFVALATAGFPVTVMIATVAATLGSLHAIGLSLVGVVLSSATGFLIGRFVRPSTGDGEASGRVARLVRRFRGRGVLGVALLRNVPVAPFAVVNVGFGATSFPLWRFLLGTVLGMTPGIVLMSMLGSEVGDWFADPHAAGLLRVLGIAAAVVVSALAAQRLFARSGIGRAASDSPPGESD